jgi:capsular polysaccharide transport system permease protein
MGLARGLSIQLRVIHALMMRESLTRYGKGKLGFFWFLLNPIIFTSVVVFIRSAVRGAFGTFNDGILVPVLISGYASVLLWRSAGGRCLSAVRSNEVLLLHRNVTAFNIVAARLALEVMGVTASTIILFAICILFELAPKPEDILLMIQGWLLIVVFSTGLGLCLTAIGRISEATEKAWPWVSLLIAPFSGLASPTDWMSSSLRDVALLNPVVHGLEIFRHGHLGAQLIPHYSIYYAYTSSLTLVLLGWILVMKLCGPEIYDNT